MTTNTSVNYTPEMVAILKANAPIDYAKAQELATQLERDHVGASLNRPAPCWCAWRAGRARGVGHALWWCSG